MLRKNLVKNFPKPKKHFNDKLIVLLPAIRTNKNGAKEKYHKYTCSISYGFVGENVFDLFLVTLGDLKEKFPFRFMEYNFMEG